MSAPLRSNRYHPYQPSLPPINEVRKTQSSISQRNVYRPFLGQRNSPRCTQKFSDLSNYFTDLKKEVKHVINGKCKYCHRWSDLYTKSTLSMRCQKCWDNFNGK